MIVSTKGIGLSILRQPIGASDFALTNTATTTCHREPLTSGDPNLKHFSIELDRAFILPLLREAPALNPHLKYSLLLGALRVG